MSYLQSALYNYYVETAWEDFDTVGNGSFVFSAVSRSKLNLAFGEKNSHIDSIRIDTSSVKGSFKYFF